MCSALQNLAALVLVLTLAACGAKETGPSSTDALEPALVKEYLLAHPELVLDNPEVSDAIHKAHLRREQGRAATQRQAVLNAHSELLESPFTPFSGSTGTDLTVIEFFDYQCAPLSLIHI